MQFSNVMAIAASRWKSGVVSFACVAALFTAIGLATGYGTGAPRSESSIAFDGPVIEHEQYALDTRQIAQSAASTYVTVATSRIITDRVMAAVGSDADHMTFAQSISVVQNPGSAILVLSATAESTDAASRTVQALSDALLEFHEQSGPKFANGSPIVSARTLQSPTTVPAPSALITVLGTAFFLAIVAAGATIALRQRTDRRSRSAHDVTLSPGNSVFAVRSDAPDRPLDVAATRIASQLGNGHGRLLIVADTGCDLVVELLDEKIQARLASRGTPLAPTGGAVVEIDDLAAVGNRLMECDAMVVVARRGHTRRALIANLRTMINSAKVADVTTVFVR